MTHRQRWRSAIGMFLAITLAPPPASTQTPFEGIVESVNTTVDDDGMQLQYKMSMWVKGEMVKVVIAAAGDMPASTIISRADWRVAWVLNESDSTYFEVRNVDEKPSGREDDGSVVKRTGKKRTILGYPCEQVLVKQGEAETEIWGTADLKNVGSALARGLGQEGVASAGGVNNNVSRLGLFPLVAKTRLAGKVLESSEVTRVVRKQLPADLFAMPEGFRKQRVGDFIPQDRTP